MITAKAYFCGKFFNIFQLERSLITGESEQEIVLHDKSSTSSPYLYTLVWYIHVGGEYHRALSDNELNRIFFG